MYAVAVLDERSHLKWIGPTSAPGIDKIIQQAIDEASGLTKGTFTPITQLPVFQIVALPTGFHALFTTIETFD